MPFVERLFTQIQPPTEDQESKPFSVFFDKSAVIVLGDPGAGKTTSLREAARIEHNAALVSVRDFLALSTQRWAYKTLYLDGLDEQRAKTRDGSAVLDQIRTKLDQLGRPVFRLSCRAADWFGSSDADRLRLLSSDGSITVVRLEALSEDNIQAIASEYVQDPVEFIEEARNRQIYDLLLNPQTLILILKVVGQGLWPKTRAELYQKACEILGREINPEHTDFQGPSLSSQDIITSAGYMCALHLCGGTAGYSLTVANADKDFPFIGELTGNREALSLSARRRIFRTEGPSRITPIHRTVAEYLGGQFLADRIRTGLPLQRVLALVTGYDGGTLSELRGLYAWLSCLLSEHAGALIPRDPLGIVLYGDASVLTSSTKQLVLKSLARLAEQNAWFRVEAWSSKPFGGLSSPDMLPFFRDALRDKSAHPVFQFCVMDALQHGTPMPELGALLLEIARDDSRNTSFRSGSISTFHKICPDHINDLSQLLEDIHAGTIKDISHTLRGDLFQILYPSIVGPDRILQFCVAENENHFNSYTHFIADELVSHTTPDQLPLLVDSLRTVGIPSLSRLGFIWEQFVGRLMLALLINHGDRVSSSCLYNWLGNSLDKYRKQIVRHEESTKIQAWFSEHPAVIHHLFVHWLSVAPFSKLRLELHDFWARLYNVASPENFPQWLLGLAEGEPRGNVSEFLFRQAVQFSISQDRPDCINLDGLFSYIASHPQFTNALEDELLVEISEWRREEAIEKRDHRLIQAANRVKRIQDLSQHAELIRTGAPSNPLIFLARLYFGRFSDVDGTLSPDERLIAETNADIGNQAKIGFVSALTHSRLPSSRDIGEATAESKEYGFGIVVMAGMDVLAATSVNRVLELPSRTHEAALAFHFSHMVDGEREWVNTLLRDRPQICGKALISFLKPQLKRGCEHISVTYILDEPTTAPVARIVLPPILKSFPFCPEEHLRILLKTAVKVMKKASLLSLARKVLKRKERRFTKKHKLLWLGISFILSPDSFQTSLSRHIGNNVELASLLLNLIFPTWHTERKIDLSFAPKELVTLISICGRIFRDADVIERGRPEIIARRTGAESVRRLINYLKDDPSSESTEALSSLRGNPELSARWGEYLGFALSDQARLRRETTFFYPTIQGVIRTLANQQPINATDLQAVILAHLKTIREDLRHGPTDGYKMFWNVDHHQRPKTPRPENDCRDRLLDQLRQKLVLNGISAEPEGHYAQDKRADIKAIFGPLNLPVEIKRHYHGDVWSAPRNQLIKLYSRDPGAQGRGIYLVFWFGNTIRNTPRPPAPLTSIPSSASELEFSLYQTLSDEERTLIEVIVFDCASNNRTRPLPQHRNARRNKATPRARTR